ncbi:GNAT family protein [Glycomyces scopariae]|uniref:[SSU ribosomal protein S5P]-alanine acetyltransferase n=1 Tax=Glycomyces sambucus TaxID=380244 RepID=A0A1G9K7Z3_9ACTN|nr:GNAT family protein [Glycomyces sambucus]SDL45525.1 [SSU ribosomal protein S5P]-alanine acetyltransferase [Glycomyces sambucus]
MLDQIPAPPAIALRPVAPADAADLAALRGASRDHLARWEPDEDDATYTLSGVREAIAAALARTAAGTGRSYVILERGRAVGGLLLNTIVQGPYLRTCSVGYWVAVAECGRGIATEAVRLAKYIAFGELGLDQLRAETLPDNLASQKVLSRNGFRRIGLSPCYSLATGRLRDHVLFEAPNPRTEPPWT